MKIFDNSILFYNRSKIFLKEINKRQTMENWEKELSLIEDKGEYSYIGNPLPDWCIPTVYVLDSNVKSVPIGARAELLRP